MAICANILGDCAGDLAVPDADAIALTGARGREEDNIAVD